MPRPQQIVALVMMAALAAGCGGDEPQAGEGEGDGGADAATLGGGRRARSGAGGRAGREELSMVTGLAPDAGPERPEPAIPEYEAGAMVRVPAGRVRAGSDPGTPGRLPEHEMDGEEVALAAFEIDALPYPNDPGEEPLVGVSMERAAELCGAAGKRLCHELEWERACEGDDGRTYPFGDRYDEARFETPRTLASPLGVLAMGTIGEWTSSLWGEAVDGRRGGVAARGPAGAKGSAASRRCARRTGLLPGVEAEGVGFRCCRGEPQADSVAYVTAEPVYPFDRVEDLGTREAFQSMIRSIPEIRRVHDDPQPFTRDDVHNLMHESGIAGPRAIKGTTFTFLPVRWIPRQGEEIVVAAGADGEDTFVVALWALPGGRFRHAASLVFVGTTRAVVLSYTRDRRYVHWNPCLSCRDGGLVTYEDGQVRITQRW